MELMFEDPLVDDDVQARTTRQKVPSVIGQQHLVLLHHAPPIGDDERVRQENEMGETTVDEAAMN